MSDVVMLSKYQIMPGEDPEVTATRMHLKKNRAINPAEEFGMEFPPYRFAPYPTAMYRDWDPDERENEIHKMAGKYALNLELRRDRLEAETRVGPYRTILVGAIDYVRVGDREEVLSEIRERNDREYAARLEEGWASEPGQVRAAKRAFEMRTSALPAAQIILEDRHLGDKGKAEFDQVNEAADNHVTDVSETRKQLQADGVLPKGKK